MSKLTVRELHDRLEDDNWHTVNALLLAIVVQDMDAVVRMCEIVLEHEKLGHMPYELCQERHKLTGPFWKRLVEEGQV